MFAFPQFFFSFFFFFLSRERRWIKLCVHTFSCVTEFIKLSRAVCLSVSGSNSVCATLSLISLCAVGGAVVRQGCWSGEWEQVASATWGSQGPASSVKSPPPHTALALTDGDRGSTCMPPCAQEKAGGWFSPLFNSVFCLPGRCAPTLGRVNRFRRLNSL